VQNRAISRSRQSHSRSSPFHARSPCQSQLYPSKKLEHWNRTL